MNSHHSAAHLRTSNEEFRESSPSKLKQPQSNDPLANQEEAEKKQSQSISCCEIFRFADSYDYLMMTIGTIGGLAVGASFPIFLLFWGEFTDVFNSSPDVIVDAAAKQLLKFVYLSIGTLFMGWCMIAGWIITGERQAVACRKAYFASLLRQQIGWFDCTDQSSLSSNFSADTLTFQKALGQTIALLLQGVGTSIGGFSVAFSQGWLMSIVCLAGMPFIALAALLYMKSLQSKAKDFQKNFSEAGGRAEQAFYSIKTVKQLNGQEYEQNKFVDMLDGTRGETLKTGIKIALGSSILSASMFLLYSLGYWFGSNCVEGNSHCPPDISGGPYSPGSAITIFFCIMMSCIYLAQLAPALKKVGEGVDAASRIFKIIDREPLIKSPENGLQPDHIQGKIVFENVTFSYPKDPTKQILDNISIQFHLNNTALVGESGCGKSTILQLIMRFYDPTQGKITLDGNDLRLLDLNWLRSKIGYVGQEPVLFATTIRQNLMFGNENASTEDIDLALKKAEAYDFVNQLENKLETYVGSEGSQLSGGQKQRIAIARALLKQPKILLLDEATSALDRKNQKLIQHTLNQISQGLTTVTVAHRVKTIMNSDIVYVISHGKIEQKGAFKELQRYRNVDLQVEEEEVLDLKDGNKRQDEEKKIKKLGQKEMKENERKDLDQLQEGNKKKKQQEKKLIEKHEQGIFRRVFSYMNNQCFAFIIGIILTLANGLVYPVSSIFLARILNAFFELESKDPVRVQQGRHDANIAGLVFLILAIIIFLGLFLRDFLTSIVGEEITSNIRKATYRKILNMPVYWFDQADNNCGILSTRLGNDCQTINGMATTYIYIVIQCLSTLVAGVTVALVFEWRIALVALGMMPIIMLSGFVKAKFRSGQMYSFDKAYKDSAQITMESLSNIRTVVSFGVENTVLHKYERYIDEPKKDLHFGALVSGFFFGLSQVMNFISFGVLFYIGTIFIRDFGVSLLDIFTAIYSIFFAGITIGNSTHFLPDINEAKLAASHIFEILDAEDESELQVRQKSQMITTGIKGHIKLDQVSFKYDSRQQPVFTNMSLEIRPGQKIALVGPSGCGKSTIVQLLQRFYLPSQGSITIDGIDIKNYDIRYLRQQFGVVSQQPALFNTSFRENIIYNMPDVTEEQLRRVAEEANALAFIEGQEAIQVDKKQGQIQQFDAAKDAKGFDRNVGMKGGHISGGQKQRIAIARAILRKPKILLLDQATSALDAENERKVQGSLDRIMSNRTTLSIAHRIETIRNSDMIHVFQKGQIVESGTYEKLMSLKGFFFNLERGTQFV